MPKAEKVVKPPQNPVTKNHFKLLSLSWFLVKIPMNIPIKKQPAIFAIKVANGKVFDQNLETKIAVKNRNTLPMAPPKAIYKMVLSMLI